LLAKGSARRRTAGRPFFSVGSHEKITSGVRNRVPLSLFNMGRQWPARKSYPRRAEVQEKVSTMLTGIHKRPAFPPAFPEVDDTRPLPAPTTALAGSEAKLAELARRARLDLQLFHPDDNSR
jgi:hypothetical protein